MRQYFCRGKVKICAVEEIFAVQNKIVPSTRRAYFCCLSRL
jgi:hypothetical protein